jgi:hypothetical protein
MGVIKHGNAEFGNLRDKQVQSDLIRLMRSIDCTPPCPFRYERILSHTDGKNKGACISTHMHKMNKRADALCKSALVDGIMSNDYISSDFPFQTIQVWAGTTKLLVPSTLSLPPTTLNGLPRKFSALGSGAKDS